MNVLKFNSFFSVVKRWNRLIFDQVVTHELLIYGGQCTAYAQ